MKLEDFTKAEIITWVKSNVFRQPKKSELLFIRWQIRSMALQKRDEANTAALIAIDGKKYNEYARQCNATDDLNVKLSLLKKMGVIDKRFKAYFAESDKINAEHTRVQKIYDQIGVEGQKEQKPSS